jgi:phosphinothricin acetyltransferase
MNIRTIQPYDYESVTEIYNFYIIHSTATFEELPLTVVEMSDRIKQISTALPWLVLEEHSRILGYAYASPWKGRSAYRFSVETSIYLAQDAHGIGAGKKLYRALLHKLLERDFHASIGGIILPNLASVTLHESLGFKQVAEFKEVGFKFGSWLNVGYWQLDQPNT